MINLTEGWKAHSGVPGGFHLLYMDTWIGEISIVTGPKGSGFMGCNDPGRETTYEAWFPGMSDPTGHLTLGELKGIIKFMRQRIQEQERLEYEDES